MARSNNVDSKIPGAASISPNFETEGKNTSQNEGLQVALAKAQTSFDNQVENLKRSILGDDCNS